MRVNIVKVRDLIAAEEALEAAEKESRALRQNPEEWSAFESLDREGRRHLHVSAAQFQRQDFLDVQVQARMRELFALRQQFAPCSCPQRDATAPTARDACAPRVAACRRAARARHQRGP
jgi:hypothetical protein